MINLPAWKLTLSPPLYDTSSKSPIEMTAHVYAKMRELVEDYNRFSEELTKAINEYEANVNGDISRFKDEVTTIMNEYVKSIDNEVTLIHNHLHTLEENYEKDVVEQTRKIIEERLNEGSLTITEVYNEETESLNFVLGGTI